METDTNKIRQMIVEYVKSYIKRRKLHENDRLMSENSLAERFNCNRNTVRSALAILKAQGIVYAQKGKGIFVAEKPHPIVFEHDNALGFSEILNQGHRDYSSHAVSISLGTATAHESAMLCLPEGTPVYRLKCVRSMHGIPFSVCSSVLPQDIVPGLDTHAENFVSVNDILMQAYGYPHPICKWVRLEASLPTSEDISLLEIPENMPILKQQSVFHIEGTGPIEYFTVRARGDMFRFTMSFK